MITSVIALIWPQLAAQKKYEFKTRPQAFPMARVAKMDVRLCPCCKVGRLQVTDVLKGQARLPAPAHVVEQQSRGPP